MASSLFGQLDRSLHDRLGELARLARRADDETALQLARHDLPRLVTAVQALLDEHRPDERGRCQTCRRGRFRRRLPSPCRAYLTAHLCLSHTDDEARGERGDPRRLRHAS